MIELVKQEIATTKALDHKHIVKYYEFKEATVWHKASGEKIPVAYIAQELVTGGELFDYIFTTGAFEESIARFFFKQMITGLHYIHTQGVAHRDLKPENILLDSKYNIKIVDFGFATPLEGKDGSGFNRTALGSPNYMAPEIWEKDPQYQAQVVDLYACAIILFIMFSGGPPFERAKADESKYY